MFRREQRRRAARRAVPRDDARAAHFGLVYGIVALGCERGLIEALAGVAAAVGTALRMKPIELQEASP